VNIDSTIAATVGIEGGYTDNPNDPGGETIYGITAVEARAFGYSGDMKSMPLATAQAIYKQRYWLQPHFDQVCDFSDRIAAKLFDIGVNMGQTTGVKYMQRALNVLNQQGKSFPDISVDGAIGAMSLAALRTFIAVRGDNGIRVLIGMIAAQQSVRYMEIAESNPTQETFEFGWQLNRAIGVGA